MKNRLTGLSRYFNLKIKFEFIGIYLKINAPKMPLHVVTLEP